MPEYKLSDKIHPSKYIQLQVMRDIKIIYWRFFGNDF